MLKLQVLGAFGILVPLALFGSATSKEADLPPDDIQIQTRGPIHEAYAQPVDFQAEPGPAVPKEPPQPVPEEPPTERPEGNNVQWISGYWGWDPAQQQFLWVSGLWRDVPVGRQWLPGHWVHGDDGWRWVPGMWVPENQQELPYTPEPPAPLEVEPALPPPDDNSFYVPGYWVYRDFRFIWRPGYYAPCRIGYVWSPPRYCWTPSGYLFSDGYWDYPLESRGLCFASVSFGRPYWNDPDWCYRPRYVVALDLLDSLFFRNNCYYYGNYFGSSYARLGYRPWFERGRDPLYNYYRWQNRNDPNWSAGMRERFAARAAGRLEGPPETFADQRLAFKNGKGKGGLGAVAALGDIDNQAINNRKIRLAKLDPDQLQAQKATQDRMRDLQQLRNKAEGGGVAGKGAFGKGSPGKDAAGKDTPGNDGPGKGPFVKSPLAKGPLAGANGEARSLKLPPLAKGGQANLTGEGPGFRKGGTENSQGIKGNQGKGPGQVVTSPDGRLLGATTKSSGKAERGPTNNGPSVKDLNPGKQGVVVRPPDFPKGNGGLPKAVTNPQPNVFAPPQPNLKAPQLPKGFGQQPNLQQPNLQQPSIIQQQQPKTFQQPQGTPPGQPKNIQQPQVTPPGQPKVIQQQPKIFQQPQGTPQGPPIQQQPKNIQQPQVTPQAPRFNPPAPQPKAVTPVPAPKVIQQQPKFSPPPAPKFNPPAAPKVNPPAPRASPPAPKFNPPAAPKISPPAPRANPPAPKFNPPAPRVNVQPKAAPAPRSAPPAPRVNPAPAPRVSAPPAPRNNPAPKAAPSGGGGGAKGGGKGKR